MILIFINHMDDTKDEPIIAPKKADSGFIKHIFNMDNDTKHNMLNIGHFCTFL